MHLGGKKLGFLCWVQTAALWMRGMLIDEYGMSAPGTEWHVASMHHWDDAAPRRAVEPRDGSTIRWMKTAGKSTSEQGLPGALQRSGPDALGVTESQLAAMVANSRFRRLFESPREIEVTHFRETQIRPSCMCWRCGNGTAEKFPELPEKLFRLFSRCGAGRNAGAGRSQVWFKLGRILTSLEERRIFKSDPWAYGLEANRHVLEHVPGILLCSRGDRPQIAAEDFFHPSTLELSE